MLNMAQEKMEILVVEDSSTQALRLRQMLESSGHFISVTQNGVEALSYLETHLPKLVISDVMMPAMDGYELCRRIKSDERLRHIPVLLLTRLSEPGDIVEGLECGADNFLTKPYEKEALMSRIQYILVNQQMRRRPCSDIGLEIYFSGKKFFINSERIQILDLLFSTYDTSLQQKHELEQINMELRDVTHQLEESNRMLEAANRKLQKLSYLDGLTGIPNRRFFDESLNNEWRRCAREKQPLALLLIDIDWFKRYNDRYGHQEGDCCLQHVAKALEKELKRGGDLVARYGGEEFVALLPNTSKEGALKVAQKMCNRIEELEIAHTRSETSDFLTISIGAASLVPEVELPSSILVGTADKAMYTAKRKGRNTVILKEVATRECKDRYVQNHFVHRQRALNN
jgi:diguanylate cyclase (GGDEF)-like protein